MTESKDSGCVEETIAANEPKRTTSEESVGKESQATTGNVFFENVESKVNNVVLKYSSKSLYIPRDLVD